MRTSSQFLDTPYQDVPFEFCDVVTLVMMHKRREPNSATGKRGRLK
jgi:hypothetical protein